MEIELTMTAPNVAKTDIPRTLAAVPVAQEFMRAQEDRVRRRGLDAQGRPLPKFKPRVWKPRERWKPSREQAAQYSRDYRRRRQPGVSGPTWDEKKKGPPPDVFQQIRVRGGRFAPKDPKKPRTWRFGIELKYSRTTIERKKRNKVWGWWWPTREAFLREYESSEPRATQSGQSWRERKVRILARRNGRYAHETRIEIGFRGRRPTGSPEQEARKAAGKRTLPASIRMYLSNGRTLLGAPARHASEARQWNAATPEERERIVKLLSSGLLRAMAAQTQVTVTYRGGRETAHQSGPARPAEE